MIEVIGGAMAAGGFVVAAASTATQAPTPTTVLGALVALGGGVIIWLVREQAKLKTQAERDERSIRVLMAFAVELASVHPDPSIRDRVRSAVDALNQEHT